MAYSTHISFNGTDYSEIYPSTDNRITYTPYGDEIFMLYEIDEIKISKLLNATVYNTLYASFFTASTTGDLVYFKVKKETTDTYYFKAAICDMKVDIEKGIISVTPKQNTSYPDVLNYYSRKTGPIHGATTSLYYWIEPSAAFVNVDFSVFADSSNVVTWTHPGDTTYKYARLSLGDTLGSGENVKILISSASNSGSVRIVDNAFAAVSNEVSVSNGLITLTLSSPFGTYLEFRKISVAPESGGFTYVAYKHRGSMGAHFLDVYLNDMLSDFGLSLTVKSTFLFRDALPSVAPSSISTYMTANPTHDYVIEATALWEGLTISNLGDGQNEITFEEIMRFLKTRRCYWYIDSDGYFRIEHEKYFRSWSSQLDITTLTNYKPEIDRKVYEYNKNNVYNQINLSEPAYTNAEFINSHIVYSVDKTTPNVNDVSAGKIITDVEDAFTVTDDRDLFLISTYNDYGVVHVTPLELGVLNATSAIQNLHLCYSYQVVNYFDYFGDADTADVNSGTTLNLIHVKEFLNQSDIKFYSANTLNSYAPVTLSLGTGWIKKMVLDLSSGFYTLDVGFDPYNI